MPPTMAPRLYPPNLDFWNMASSTTLTGSQLRAYNAIFQYPLSHNLEWEDVYAMLRQLGLVEEESNAHLRVTRNEQVLLLPTWLLGEIRAEMEHEPTFDEEAIHEVLRIEHYHRHFAVGRQALPLICELRREAVRKNIEIGFLRGT